MNRIWPRVFATLAWREVQTVVRTRTYALLAVGLTAIFVQMLRAGGGIDGGYVTAAVDLLLPMEVLVPIVAVALGYRAFTGDNNDLPVLRTYPVSRTSLTAGVFVGRLVGLIGIVGVPLAVAGGLVAYTGGPESRVFAVHGGGSSPVLFVRFVALTLLFGAVVLAMTMAASILVRTGSAALTLALAVLVAVVAGGDLLALAGLAAGTIGDDTLATALAASPNSAYRGLVFEFVVGVVVDRPGAIDVTAAVVSLVGWLAASLGIVAVGSYTRPSAMVPTTVQTWFRRLGTAIRR